jgi:hypothetical protein
MLTILTTTYATPTLVLPRSQAATRRRIERTQHEPLVLGWRRSLPEHRANTVSVRDIGAEVVVTTLVVVGHAVLGEVPLSLVADDHIRRRLLADSAQANLR